MTPKKKVSISWSGGKDSAFALYRILLSGEYEIVSLHTVFNEETKRVGLHGVHEGMIEQQAAQLDIPLKKLYLPGSEDHDAYSALMKSFYRQCAHEQLEGIVFGDIFLEDLRKYREELLQESGLDAIFPLWGLNTAVLVDDFINTGFKTILCSADAAYFNQEDLGKVMDYKFVLELSHGVDPCGENGEFHTFVYDGPMFKRPIEFRLRNVVLKEYSYQKRNEDGSIQKLQSAFWFQDFVAFSVL